MVEMPSTRDRFLRDGLPVRLGGIAANLARVSSYSRHDAGIATVSNLINESKWFIEWTAADFLPDDVEAAAQLVDLQRQLTRWQRNWEAKWNDPEQRAEIAAVSREWSDRLMEMSGLLE